jgi:segregation and condensation protein B
MSQLPDDMNEPDPMHQAAKEKNLADGAETPVTDVADVADATGMTEMAVSEADQPSENSTDEIEGIVGASAEKELSEALIETLDAGDIKKDAATPVAEEDIVVPDVSDLPPAELRAAVEAVLFVATKPLTIARLQRALPGTSTAYLEGFLHGLAVRYTKENRGWELRPIAGGWQLLTRRDLYPWVRQLERKELPTRLSKGALETLAIVAYKQPITRGAIEDIRGVQCGPVLRQLMDLKLVLVTGRDEEAIGRPLLYGTTDAFLTRFGLGRVEDLPRRHEFGA